MSGNGFFDMGAQALSQAKQDTGVTVEDLLAAVGDLRRAGEPLEGHFNGRGAAAWESFKENSELLSSAVQASLARINYSQDELDKIFHEGDDEQDANAQRGSGQVNFDLHP